MSYVDKEKARAYRKAHYEKHKEEYKKRALEWYYANRDLCIERIAKRNSTPEGRENRKRWYHNKGTAFYVAKTNEWRKNNPEKAKQNHTIYVARRRARLANAAGLFSFEGWMQKVQFHGWRCVYCKLALDKKALTIDHKIPLSKGGTNWLANLVPACKPCNSRKAAKRDFYETAAKIRDIKFEDVDL
jgi:5-methylcytosine-specific restriction endonuclease McrA